jgi:hypothetical protein
MALFSLLNSAYHIYHVTQKKNSADSVPTGFSVAAGLSLGARTAVAKAIQKRHHELVEKMKHVEMLQRPFEAGYPKGWISANSAAKTHPVFYVKRNGDLVFLKPTRAEYYRYAFQKSFSGKIGLNPWRWRAYIRKPEAPEPVNALAQKWAKNLAKSLAPKRKPAFGIASSAKPLPVKRAHSRRRI